MNKVEITELITRLDGLSEEIENLDADAIEDIIIYLQGFQAGLEAK